MTPRTLLRLSPLLLVLAASDAVATAPDTGACCVQSTSRLDNILNPTVGSDENFFATTGGAPNVLLVLDNSGSMNDWAVSWPTARGCRSQGTTGHGTWGLGYDADTAYRGLITGITAQNNATEDPDWFTRTKFYNFDPDHSLGHNFAGASTATIYATAAASCTAAGAASGTDATTCVSCLATDGYYVYDSSHAAASGNYLNYAPPKDVGAMLVLSHLVFDVREVRMGVMTMADWSNNPSANCWAGSCLCKFQDFGPSCDKSYPLDQSAVQNSRNAILNKMNSNYSWGACNTPLTGSMYAAANWFRSTSPEGFPSGWPTSTAMSEDTTGGSTAKRSICQACGFNAIIFITDGNPNTDNLISLPAALTDSDYQVTDCTGSDCGNHMDEVAKWLWNNDVRADWGGPQKVATYTIGLAVDANATGLLTSAAKAGGGSYFGATSAAELNQRIMDILTDIVARNYTFATTAVASVQTSGTGLQAIMPRLLPLTAQPWIGTMYRFEQFNEFVTNVDKNTDGDKADVFTVDSAGDIVSENDDGVFVKTVAATGALTGTPATPYWEANKQLKTMGHAARHIWTVRDSTNDGAFTSDDTTTEFTVANWSTLAPYLGIVGTAYCPLASGDPGTLLTSLRLTPQLAAVPLGLTLSATPTQAELDQLCVRALISYVRGMDLADENGNSILTDTRPSVLADIYHSSPVDVVPPVDTFLCDLGLHNQCTRTLYAESLPTAATPLASTSETETCTGTQTRKAYESYRFANRKRDKTVLVGSNDGLLHAFHNGAATEVCTSATPVITYDKGTGNEQWAFISPDLLPRLQDYALGHIYGVDGDTMVRDVWADGSGSTAANDQKENDEYHTVAIASEGRGGTHYFAVEVVWDASKQHLDTKPKFLWMYPQPCSRESETFGKTFMALSPKPPPIGPVLIKKTADVITAASGITRYGVPTLETWVVALSGGWSPALEKGRGVYLVDAYRGAINGNSDNLWFKAEYTPAATGEQLAPLASMTHSITAPVALADYGSNTDVMQDGFFDTFAVGDTAGQMWVGRMFAPGIIDSTTKHVTNWAVGRAFEMDRDGVITGTDEDSTASNAKSVANQGPFHYLPSIAVDPLNHGLRFFLGSGNRYALLEDQAGVCRFDNPLACSKYKCAEVKTIYTMDKVGLTITKDETHWKSRAYEHSKLDTAVSSKTACGTAGGVAVTAAISYSKTGDCNYTSGADYTATNPHLVSAQCGLNADGSIFTCQRTDTNVNLLGDLLDATRVDTTGLGKNRYFGFWGYGGTTARTFDESLTTVDATAVKKTAKQYDTARLSDRAVVGGVATSGDLLDVTGVTCNATGCTNVPAATTGGTYGWFYEYANLNEKTASGSAVLASCTLWSNIAPGVGTGTTTCGGTITTASRLFQGDFRTGYPNCAASYYSSGTNTWSRYVQRSVVAPPPEPTVTVQISTTGQVKYSAMIVEPGKPQATSQDITLGQDVLQSVYELPVSRGLHACRHGAAANCVTVP